MICNKIGVDFHGVINTNPMFFKKFCELAIKQNIEVHIVSGGPREDIIEFLTLHQIKYDYLWCIYDYFEAKEEVVYGSDGSFHVEDEAWNEAKALYCRQNNINVQIDDSLIYGKYFTTPYCLYDEHKKSGVLNGKVIDFCVSAQNSLDDILASI